MVRVEYVRTIFMHGDALYVEAVDVAARMRPLVYHQTPFAGLFGFVGEYGTEQPCPYYEKVVLLHGE